MERFVVRRLVNPDGVAEDRDILVDEGRIAEVRPAAAEAAPGAGGLTAVPGFIDLHTHGAVGHDIMDAHPAGLAEIARHHLRNGTTSFLGSTLTAPLEEVERVLSAAREYATENVAQAQEGRAASLVGIHLEGPWLAPEQAGAQNTSYMHAPAQRDFHLIRANHDLVRMATFSYHYESSPQFLALLNNLGIIAACGHDRATDDLIARAFEDGLRYVTHLFSMNSSFHRVNGYKHLGMLEMALMTPGITVEAIVDGRHVTQPMWRFLRHNKNPDDIVIVSDSNRAAWLPEDPDRVIRLGELEAVVDHGVAWLADRSAFAGSVSTIARSFRLLAGEWGVPMTEAVRMTATNQARLLGLEDDLGSIEVGKRADFVLLDEELNVVQVIKAGRVADV